MQPRRSAAARSPCAVSHYSGREMGAPLTDLYDARQVVLSCASALPDERVALADALGRVLAHDVVASEPVPAFDSSAMDGFAVHASDLETAAPGSPSSLRVVDESRAGRPASRALGLGEAIAISTGAVIPDGADAIVRIEDVCARNGNIEISAPIPAGSAVRHTGDDIDAGALVLARGTAIGPAQLGVLASLGELAPVCHRRPRVAVLTTGDELSADGESLDAGMVRDSSSYAIPALALRTGAEVVSVAHAPDERTATTAALERALRTDADVIVVCGGVSVGAHDHVRESLGELAVRERFFRIALRPGKPTWFGTRGRTLVLALPGNPVSAMVTFILLARPALWALAGADVEQRRSVAQLSERYEKEPGRAHAVRCTLSLEREGWCAHPTGAQDSHILTSMLGAEALAIIPAEHGPVEAGEQVEIELLDEAPAGVASSRRAGARA